MNVLIVEDEQRLARALQRGLAAEGFSADVAFDGVTGHRLASENAYDAIILDIMLPGLNGYQVCARLREAGDWTPILMLTAKDGEYDESEALDTGADDYLTKPFSYLVLVARLRALLRRAGKPVTAGTVASERMAIGDLVILPAEHRCLRGDREIRLTAREFDILAYLARRAGTVVRKSELIDALWDFAAPPDANVVEVHVSSLRRKIDTAFARHSIATIRGVGYRLDPDDSFEGGPAGAAAAGGAG